MDDNVSSDSSPTRLEGKFKAIIVCWFLGLGSLISWNSMLTILGYYDQVFPHYHPARVLTLVYQPFANVTMAILAYNESKLNTRRRNIFGYILFCLSTLGLLLVSPGSAMLIANLKSKGKENKRTLLLGISVVGFFYLIFLQQIDLGTSGKGGIGNYIGICIFVAGFGVADAHVQGGMVGDLAFMYPEFNQSFFAGLAASGALTSGLRLITKAAFDKTDNGLRKGVILFLAISTFLEFICIFLYAFVFGKLPIVKYFRKKAASEGSATVTADLAAVGIQTSDNGTAKYDRLSTKQLLLKNIDYALDLFVIYVLTLSIFPGFINEDTGHHQLGSWYTLVLTAMYNVWDLIARYLPLIKCIRLESRKGLLIASLSRFLLIPCFYFTAKYGDQGWMIFLISFLGLSNGYLTVCVLTAAPKGYKAPEQNALGNLLVLFLLAGLFCGAALDWLWIIGNSSF